LGAVNQQIGIMKPTGTFQCPTPSVEAADRHNVLGSGPLSRSSGSC